MKSNLLAVIFCFLICNPTVKAQDQENKNSTTNHRERIVELLKKKEYQEAIVLGKESYRIHNNAQDSLAMTESLYLISRSYALSGDFKNALDYGGKAAKLAQLIHDFPLEYKINNTLSWANYEEGIDFSKSLEHQKRQIFVVEQLDDPKARALVYNNYGYDSTVAGSIPLKNSIEYMTFANAYYAKEEESHGRWYTLMNLAWQHRLMGDLDASQRYGILASEQAKKDEDRHAIIEAYTTLGETLMAQGRLSDAKPYYEEAFKLSENEVDRDKYVFDVYYSRYLWNIGRKEKAIHFLEKAVDFLEASEVFYEMLGRAYLANFYAKADKPALALEQIGMIENPRQHYISFETRFLAALTKAELLQQTDPNSDAVSMENMIKHAEEIGAKYLVNLHVERMN